MAAHAQLVFNPAEASKALRMLRLKYPLLPVPMPEDVTIFRVTPTIISVIDYSKGFGHTGGPCPPIGRHRYFHKLYALDITLDLKGATKAQIEPAMQGHIVANAELIGTYQKGDR